MRLDYFGNMIELFLLKRVSFVEEINCCGMIIIACVVYRGIKVNGNLATP